MLSEYPKTAIVSVLSTSVMIVGPNHSILEDERETTEKNIFDI